MDKLTPQQKRRIIRIGLQLYANFVRQGRENIPPVDSLDAALGIFRRDLRNSRIEEDLIIGSYGPVPNLEQIESVYREVSSK